MTDNVNHPAHYAPRFESRQIECIDITRHLSFDAGNAFKYVWRAGSKGDKAKALEDIDKAAFYLDDACAYELCAKSDVAASIFDLLHVYESERYCVLGEIACGDFESALQHLDKLREEVLKEIEDNERKTGEDHRVVERRS